MGSVNPFPSRSMPKAKKAWVIKDRDVLDVAALGDVEVLGAFFDMRDHPPPESDHVEARERLAFQESELAACAPAAVVSPVKSRQGLPEVMSPSADSPARVRNLKSSIAAVEESSAAAASPDDKKMRPGTAGTARSYAATVTTLDAMVATTEDLVKYADGVGNTALHVAAAHGHFRVCRLLLDHGADVNAATDSGLTPLHCAAQHGYLRLVELLLERGAKAYAWSQRYELPLSLAMRGRYADIEVVLGPLTRAASDSKDVLVAAAKGDLLHLLLAQLAADGGKEACAKRDSQMEDTMLHVACKVGEMTEEHYAFVAAVLDEKLVSVDATNANRQTPLMLAAKAANTRLLKMLIDAGANPLISADPEDAARTALSFASDSYIKVSLDEAERKREFDDVYATRNSVRFSERADFVENVRGLKRRWDEARQTLDVYRADNNLDPLW